MTKNLTISISGSGKLKIKRADGTEQLNSDGATAVMNDNESLVLTPVPDSENSLSSWTMDGGTILTSTATIVMGADHAIAIIFSSGGGGGGGGGGVGGSLWDRFTGWVVAIFHGVADNSLISQILARVGGPEEIARIESGLTTEQKDDPRVKAQLEIASSVFGARKTDLLDPLTALMAGWLAEVQSWTQKYHLDDPATAQNNAAKMAVDIVGMNSAVQTAELALAAIPNQLGPVAAAKTGELWSWLGFSATINAVAHDPVKIGVLRPWGDSLEAIFRNRRPDAVQTLQAYIQRSLSTSRIVNDPTIPVGGVDRTVDGQTIHFFDLAKMVDADMDRIDEENNANLDSIMARHGYSQEFIDILKDAATKSLTFGNLSSMAKMGHYRRDMSMFSLWGMGLDRRLMVEALDTLEVMNSVSLYSGFRSLIEPAYVEGDITADELRDYYTKINIPKDVQDNVLPRLTRRRDAYALKQQGQQQAKTRDLTQANFAKAYKLQIITAAEYDTKLTALGFDADERTLLKKIADEEQKPTAAKACKHLPLSDYEKAFKNGILEKQAVLDRMTGEYCAADIAIEDELLDLEALTGEAVAKEKDLTIAELKDAYNLNVITADQLHESLLALGFDEAEVQTLHSVIDIKKSISAARRETQEGTTTITRERDLTISQVTKAYIQNVIVLDAYTQALTELGYDDEEIGILVGIADHQKKLPTLEGLKRLPLGDYERAWKYGLLTRDQVLDRMKGEYRTDDIQLERILLDAGKP